ncbi:MAG: alpha/beta hydrolase, partial [bacterium]|nr:alpha/beta hydrolase [bacterium]
GMHLTRWDVRDQLLGLVGAQAGYAGIAKLADIWNQAIFGGPQRELALDLAAQNMKLTRSEANTNAGKGFSIVNCLDYRGRPTINQETNAVHRQSRLGPWFAGSLTTSYAVGCAGLDLESDPVPRVGSGGADVPILIVGSTLDAYTPALWTARMSRAFLSARTVTYAGGQHVAWLNAGSRCVDRIANRFMLTGDTPATDQACSYAGPHEAIDRQP